MKRKIYLILIIICCAVFLFGGYMVYRHYAEEEKQMNEFEQLAELIEAPPEQPTNTDTPPSEEKQFAPDYSELYRQNPDMIGWISIDGTTINYPVMQSIDRPKYYLKRNFKKEYSDYGVPFVDENCDIETSDNIIIYGHHMKGGKMFGTLESYKDKGFYEQHKIIQFNTLTEQADYEIIAVFKTVAYSSGGFHYNNFINASDENEFNEYVARCKALSFYDTVLSAESGNKLITLSTCEYSNQNGRLVVVARKITD